MHKTKKMQNEHVSFHTVYIHCRQVPKTSHSDKQRNQALAGDNPFLFAVR